MTVDVLRDLAIGDICPSPSNPRLKFNGIEELAASIKEKGLISPVTVRPAPKGRSKPPYELVVGERRWRACDLAKLETIKAFVRDLSDKDVLELQVIENNQRSDVHPIEEADAYRALIDKHKHSVETLAAKTGRSTSYVRQRLKLCDLAPVPRKAFLEERLNPSVALMIARLPSDPKLQAQATSEVLGEGSWKDYEGGIGGNPATVEVQDDKGKVRKEAVPLDVREARLHIQKKYMLRLELAPFDTADATLVAKAGACTTCPKRTGNQRELFADVKSADVCTDPACFATKKSADWDRKSAAAAKAGLRVLGDKEADKVFRDYGGRTQVDTYSSPYVDPKGELPYELQTPKRKKWKDLLGTATPAQVLVQDGAGAARTLWDKQSALATARKSGALKEVKAEKAARSTPRQNDYAAQQSKRQAAAKKRHAIARAAFAKLAGLKPTIDAKFWRWLAASVAEMLDAEDVRAWLRRRDAQEKAGYSTLVPKLVAAAAKVPDAELPGFVVELVASFRAVGGAWAGNGGYGKNFNAACSHFKVDLAKCKAEVLAGEKAKKSAKGKSAGGKVDRDVLSWLTECPAGDVNFGSNLARANVETLRSAAVLLSKREGAKTALAKVRSRLRKLEGN